MPIQDEHEAALQRLVASGQLTAAQAEAVRKEFQGVPIKPAKTGWLVEAAAYAGGGLMLAGASLFLGTAWDSLSQELKVIMLSGIATVFVAAAFFLGAADGIRRVKGAKGRAAGALLALAALPASFAAEVAAGDNEGMWAMVTGLVVSVAALAIRSSALSIIIGAFMTGGAVILVADELARNRTLPVAFALIIAGALWIVASLLNAIRPQQLGYVAGVVLAIVGAQYPLGRDDTKIWSYVLTLAIAAAFFAFFRLNRSIVMLVGGVAGLTLAVPEWVYDLTNGGLSPAVILLIAGLVLLVGSAFGMQLRRSTARNADTTTSNAETTARNAGTSARNADIHD